MGGIFIGAVLLGAAFGWRADIVASDNVYSGGTLVFVYLMGGLGFAILVGGVLDRIQIIVRGPDSVKSWVEGLARKR
jgi:hypothetical protein